MQPLDFIAEVLPPPGNGKYCFVELSGKKEHVFVDNLEDAQPKLDAWKASGHDIFFALGTFNDKGRRLAVNLLASRCLAVDVDCNHPDDLPDPKTGKIKQKAYSSAQDAVSAILKFSDEIELTGLGQPWLVSSGGGVHAYWPFTETIAVDDWLPVAEAFKRLCFQRGLQIDPTVTGDASRVLRVPDTVNRGVKNGKRVRKPTRVEFQNSGDHFDFEDIRALVTKHLVGTMYEAKPKADSNALALPGTRPSLAPTPTSIKLFENSVTKFGKIIKLTAQGEGCGQLAHYLEHASDDGMEPLWRAHLSIAQKCADGERAAKWLSDKHPYDEDRMQLKLAEIKGPYPCTKFDSENPGVCPGCQHWGKITNPLSLGREVAVVTEPVVVEIVKEEGEVERILRPEPPRGYAYGQRGGIFMEKEMEDAEGKKVMKQVMILPFDLFPVDILNVNGEHMVHFLASRPYGTQEIMMPQKSVVGKEEAIKMLASQNILSAFGAGNDKNLLDYVRASVAKMSDEKQPTKVPAHYGWQKDDSFVHASMVYRKNEAPLRVPMPGLENITSNTQLTGSLDAWSQFIKLLVGRKMWDHLAVIFMGAGSPLMRFTGLYGLTVHCCSTESGTGKSLALDGASSIWGHPIHYRTGSGTSPVAMQQRLGIIHSGPFVSDEITSKSRDDFEWFPGMTMTVSEGRGKERMESGANKERLNLSVWQAIAIFSSNTHAVDYMTGARKHSSEGELRRMLEWVMDEKLEWNADEVKIIKSLQNNYAVAGDAWVQYMVNHVDDLARIVPENVTKMYSVLNAPNDERFWMAGIGCMVTAAICFNKNHANIVDVPVEPLIDSCRKVVENIRAAMKVGKRDAEDILNNFIREYYGKFVIVRYGDKANPFALLGGDTAIDKQTTRSEVMGRIEHGVVAGHVDLYIEERLLRAYCANYSFGYTTFKKQVEQKFMVSYMQRKDLLAKTSGPPMKVNAMKISRREDEVEEITHSLAMAQS